MALIASCAALVAAAVVSAVTVSGLRSHGDQPRRRPTAPRGVAGPPQQLRDVAATLDRASRTAYELDRSLRPILRTVARHRLAARGVDLDRDAAVARVLLGEELAELVRADRPRAENRLAPGWPAERLRAVVDRLEAL
jgi:hypothetical protein